tara:strand:+ start:6274 stop:6492 length:219 start_codon:yes stop_codon:yes gene_type:complete
VSVAELMLNRRKKMTEKINKIILTAEGELEDKALRELVKILETKIETINERTKTHTIDIRDLRKAIKEIIKV